MACWKAETQIEIEIQILFFQKFKYSETQIEIGTKSVQIGLKIDGVMGSRWQKYCLSRNKMVYALSFGLLPCLICLTRQFSLLIRALSYFSINESLTFFYHVIKRYFSKKPIQEMSLVTIAVLS